MKQKYIYIGIGVILFFFLFIWKSTLLDAQIVRLDYREDTLVDDMLLDLGKISDESVPPKVFFLDVPILTYHQIRPITPRDDEKFRRFITSPEEFEKQMQFLKNENYKVITLLDIEDHLAKHIPLEGRNVAITFDDGYESQYQYALPILKKYSYPGTFFIYTNAIDKLSVSMTWAEVIDLSKEGMTIGAHTRTHSMLTKISDDKILDEEIRGSKEDIEAHIHKPVELFAYPYGEYNDKIITDVSQAGYRGGAGVNMGHLQTYQQRFALKRYNINDDDAQFHKIFSSLLKQN